MRTQKSWDTEINITNFEKKEKNNVWNSWNTEINITNFEKNEKNNV